MVEKKICSKCGQDKPLSAYRFRKERNTYKANCKQCDQEQHQRYVSTEQGKASKDQSERKRNNSAERLAYRKQWAQDNKELVNERARRKSCPVYFLTCVVTGKLFTARTLTTKLSREGQLIRNREKSKDKFVAVPKYPKPCKHCGNAFNGNLQDVYCSDECSAIAWKIKKKETKNYRRRARRYGCEYQPLSSTKVFERDQWTCQLCGIETPKVMRGTTEANAPELDHIKPMSRGGAHSTKNTQCLCRQCNSRKGATYDEMVYSTEPMG